MLGLLAVLISAFMAVLFVRCVLSWIPERRGFLATVDDVCHAITEPVVGPVRRVIPPLGGLDVSIIVVFIGLYIVRSLLR